MTEEKQLAAAEDTELFKTLKNDDENGLVGTVGWGGTEEQTQEIIGTVKSSTQKPKTTKNLTVFVHALMKSRGIGRHRLGSKKPSVTAYHEERKKKRQAERQSRRAMFALDLTR